MYKLITYFGKFEIQKIIEKKIFKTSFKLNKKNKEYSLYEFKNIDNNILIIFKDSFGIFFNNEKVLNIINNIFNIKSELYDSETIKCLIDEKTKIEKKNNYEIFHINKNFINNNIVILSFVAYFSLKIKYSENILKQLKYEISKLTTKNNSYFIENRTYNLINLAFQTKCNLNDFNIAAGPDFIWNDDNPETENVYNMGIYFYLIDKRFNNISNSLSIIQEHLIFINQRHLHYRGFYLEIGVFALIFIEVFIAIFYKS